MGKAHTFKGERIPQRFPSHDNLIWVTHQQVQIQDFDQGIQICKIPRSVWGGQMHILLIIFVGVSVGGTAR